MKKPTLFQERLAPCQEELRGLYTCLLYTSKVKIRLLSSWIIIEDSSQRKIDWIVHRKMQHTHSKRYSVEIQ